MIETVRAALSERGQCRRESKGVEGKKKDDTPCIEAPMPGDVVLYRVA